jgi:malate dehydrogenase (oxaloacetate-decarboxylating)(NADP+)
VKAAMESGVALNPNMVGINMKKLLDRLGNDNKMVRLITNRAKIDPKKLSCRSRSDVLKAAHFVLDEGISQPFIG